MPTGVSLQLFDGSTPQASLSGIQALWWDVTEPKDASRPVGKSTVVTTDTSGFISLDLSNVTGLAVGDYGFLMLYKKDATDHQDSLVFSGKVQTSTVASGVDMYYYNSGWTRPAGWLALPTVLPTEEKVVGLYQILPESSFIAFTCAGAYTVDWGDGFTENFATGITAYHQYDYEMIEDVSPGTEITVNNLTYKQAIVTITPQAGNNLTSINFNVRHTATTVGYSAGWLDLVVSSPSLSTLEVSAGTKNIRLGAMNQFQLLSTNTVADFSNMFNTCIALQSIPLLNTAAGTNFSYMFYGCTALQSIPLLNTAAGTNLSFMFSSCTALQSIPLLNTAAGTNLSYMFYGCTALQSIPLLNTAAGTNLSYMFYYCRSLQSIPLLNTAAGTNFSNMFNTCTVLQSVPLLNTAAGTDLSSMFYGCTALQEIPLLSATANASFSSVFNACPSLSKGAFANTKVAINYANCKLSATALNEIYTNLYGPVTGQTITVTGNWGTTSDSPAIATAKGWTVTG